MSAGRRGSERLDEHPQTPPLCVFCQETPLVRRDSAMTKIGKYNFVSFVRHSTREWSSECWAKDAGVESGRGAESYHKLLCLAI